MSILGDLWAQEVRGAKRLGALGNAGQAWMTGRLGLTPTPVEHGVKMQESGLLPIMPTEKIGPKYGEGGYSIKKKPITQPDIKIPTPIPWSIFTGKTGMSASDAAAKWKEDFIKRNSKTI